MVFFLTLTKWVFVPKANQNIMKSSVLICGSAGFALFSIQVDGRPTRTPGVEEHHQHCQQLFFSFVMPDQDVLPYGGVSRRSQGQFQDAQLQGGAVVHFYFPHRLRWWWNRHTSRDAHDWRRPSLLRRIHSCREKPNSFTSFHLLPHKMKTTNFVYLSLTVI